MLHIVIFELPETDRETFITRLETLAIAFSNNQAQSALPEWSV